VVLEAFAKRDRWEIVEEFYDADVSGADPIESRPGFSALLDRIQGNGVRTGARDRKRATGMKVEGTKELWRDGREPT
jgi:DNA invertase Pin-like site-specific DNA recombinase